MLSQQIFMECVCVCVHLTTLNIRGTLRVSCYCAGLRIISNLDEVAFIQNLVFYIEAAYKVAVSNIDNDYNDIF